MEEKLKGLNKPVCNFLKMLNEKSCDIFKVNYWNGLEGQLRKANISGDVLIHFIFVEILSKSNDIFKSKNLLYCIFDFLKSQGHEKVFLTHTFDLLNTFIQNYEENHILFRNYLIELSINLILDYIDVFNTDLMAHVHAYIRSLVELDLSHLFLVLRNNIEFEDRDIALLLVEKAKELFMTILANADEMKI
jgi:hypothetical protein